MTDATELSEARGWVFDVDGCLVRTARAGGSGGTPFPGAVELVAALQAAGRHVLLCTNASARPPGVYAAQLRDLGFDVADDEFVTAGSATADHVLAEHPGARVLVLGGDGLIDPLRARGIEVLDADSGSTADVVVVGAADTYSSALLNGACLAVDAGAPLYSTVQTPWFHGGLGKSVAASSAMAAAVSWVTGVEPVVTGKPSPALARRLLARFGTADGGLLVIGDHVAEVRLAHAMGARSVVVLSGALDAEQLAALPPEDVPSFIFPDVGTVADAVIPHLSPTVGARP